MTCLAWILIVIITIAWSGFLIAAEGVPAGFQNLLNGRNLGSALGISAFWLILSGMVVLLIYVKAPIFLPIFLGLFDVLFLLFVADFWFYKSAVDVSPRGLTVAGGLLGLGKTRWVDASDVAKIEPVPGMHSGQTAYYNLVVTFGAGKQITIGKRLASHRLATAAIGQIEQAMHKQ